MKDDTTCTLLDEAMRFVSNNAGQDSAKLVARLLQQGARMNAEIASLRDRAARAEAAWDAISAAANPPNAHVVPVIQAFVLEHGITCAETIYQTDRVIEGAYDFIKKLCDIVGYLPSEGDENE